MAKAQDLPLNPAKISGLCNRLLCCLTYEYESYKVMKKGMPRVGRQIQFGGKTYLVTRQIP
jgi:cell fate regulator YaaT (PSP1 superfamily)